MMAFVEIQHNLRLLEYFLRQIRKKPTKFEEHPEVYKARDINS